MSQRFDLLDPARGQNFTGELQTAVALSGVYDDADPATLEATLQFSHAVNLSSMVATDWGFQGATPNDIYEGSEPSSSTGATLHVALRAVGSLGDGSNDLIYTNNGNRLTGPGGAAIAGFTLTLTAI